MSEQADEPLRVGDWVHLRTGGPEMVVTRFNRSDESGDFTKVVCRWFDEAGTPWVRLFPIADLVRSDPTTDHPALGDGSGRH